MHRQFVRYLAAGAINTACTYALLIVAMQWIAYLAAYTIAYIVGIALGYWFQSRFVFGARFAWRTALRFPLVYVVQYAFGFALLWFLVETVRVGSDRAALIVVVVNVPLGFALSRLLLARRSS